MDRISAPVAQEARRSAPSPRAPARRPRKLDQVERFPGMALRITRRRSAASASAEASSRPASSPGRRAGAGARRRRTRRRQRTCRPLAAAGSASLEPQSVTVPAPEPRRSPRTTSTAPAGPAARTRPAAIAKPFQHLPALTVRFDFGSPPNFSVAPTSHRRPSPDLPGRATIALHSQFGALPCLPQRIRRYRHFGFRQGPAELAVLVTGLLGGRRWRCWDASSAWCSSSRRCWDARH